MSSSKIRYCIEGLIFFIIIIQNTNTCFYVYYNREAIDHLLEALNQQASAVSTKCQSPALSDTIWSTLRLAISMAERPELFKAVNER